MHGTEMQSLTTTDKSRPTAELPLISIAMGKTRLDRIKDEGRDGNMNAISTVDKN